MALRLFRKRTKFSSRKISVRGSVALGIAIVSLLVFFAIVQLAFKSDGGMSLLSMTAAGLGLIAAVSSFVEGIISVRQEDIYKLFPVLAIILGALSTLLYLAVYVLGAL